MNARFDERLAERTRLARDFHDTLLQTIQGSKLIADYALAGSPDSTRLKAALERLSGWLGQATQEGRSALNALRSSIVEGNDLAEGFRRAGDECVFKRLIEFNVSVEGNGREMHPIVREEVYRIGYEAIRNACSHSGARVVMVELSYVDGLKLRVCDNGNGIEPDLATEGKSGHYGLVGMYERASRIGARLTISSSAGSGTDVKLIVPYRIAFDRLNPGSRKRFDWLRRIFERRSRDSSISAAHDS
jgi:signal transduction histidine kinase